LITVQNWIMDVRLDAVVRKMPAQLIAPIAKHDRQMSDRAVVAAYDLDVAGRCLRITV
jgi:hypothetical protein